MYSKKNPDWQIPLYSPLCHIMIILLSSDFTNQHFPKQYHTQLIYYSFAILFLLQINIFYIYVQISTWILLGYIVDPLTILTKVKCVKMTKSVNSSTYSHIIFQSYTLLLWKIVWHHTSKLICIHIQICCKHLVLS